MIDYVIIPLGEILGKEYVKEKLESAFKKFSCQRERDLEDFLMQKSIAYEKTNYGKTYLFIDENKLVNNNEFIVLAYFTIAQNSLDISTMSKKKKRKILGEYPGRDSLSSISTYLIGQLGRCDNCSSLDLSGQQILDECYHAISLAARIVGGNMLILECREHMFEKFYQPQGFKKLYDELNEESLFTLFKKINFEEYWNT